MISPSSLSAFSAANGVSPASRVAAPTSPARAPSPDAVQKSLQTAPSGSPPARTTPRGSLLDLSV